MTWTTISANVNVGDTTFTTTDTVDWQVGEQIVVASTSFVHEQAERKTITAVSGNTFTVDSAFAYKHVSVVENHGSDKLEMRAEEVRLAGLELGRTTGKVDVEDLLDVIFSEFCVGK